MAERGRAFTFTINNFDENTEEYLQGLECRYIVYGYEIAPTTLRPHFQGYVYFDNARSSLAIRKLIKGHIEVAKGAPEQNFDYCSKDGHYYERGQRPISDKAKGANEKERFKRARELALAGDFASIDDDLYTRYHNSYKRMHREDALPPVTDLDTKQQGLWIYGPTGTGKSHKARADYPNAYIKDLNKWWDGYQGEDAVIIDEYEPEHSKYLTSFMKKWVDKWKFSAEYKGGRSVIRPKMVIVTSNYSMEECFTGVNLAAIKRRFKVVHMPFAYEPAMSLSSAQTAM